MCNSHFDWRGLLSIISAGCGQLVKMLIIPELHGIFDYLYIFLKLAGKITKKIFIKKKYWSCQDLNYCAPGCWITRKPPRPPHMKYTLEQFTYLPFTCTPQIKIARPLSLHYIALCESYRTPGLHYNLARPLWYIPYNNLPIYPLHVLIRLKLHDHWFAHQIKIAVEV